jgi:hypothetical protein
MPRLYFNLKASPKFQEFLDTLQKLGQKFLGQSYMFDEDKLSSGYTFKEDITFKKGDQIDITLWLGETKNGKAKPTITISPFEEAWQKKQENDAKFKNSNKQPTSTSSSQDADDIDWS